jgi:hypothetical protein
MFENLNQPYPFNNNFKHNLRTIVMVSMGFMLLVLYFQPFGINFMTAATDGYFVLAIGIISGLILFTSTLILPGFFPNLFESARWTVKKELIWNFCMLVAMAVSFAVTAILFNIQGLLSLTVFRSGALAVLPLVLFNVFNYNNSLKERVTKAIDSGRQWFNDEPNKAADTAVETVNITSENGKEVLKKELKDIVLIQSASNYIEIFYRDGAKIRMQLLRQTLQAVELHLEKYEEIKKCHRRCLVNLDQITRIAGKPSSYVLEVDGLDFKIPLSRHKVAEFRKLLAIK